MSVAGSQMMSPTVRVALAAFVVLSLLAGAVGCKQAVPPQVGFSAAPTTGQAALQVKFTDQSTGEITSWEWDFNADGRVDSVERNPEYVYTVPGTYGVTLRVNGPGGSDVETRVALIDVAVPVSSIAAVSPSSGNRGDTISVVITGANLAGASAPSFGAGITPGTFNVDSPTQVTATITIDSIAAPGPRNVFMVNPLGNATLPNGFTVLPPPPPALTAVSPATGDQGAKLQVVVTGYDLTPDCAAGFGDGVTVTGLALDSPTLLRGNISVAGNTTAGPRDLTVTNAGGTAILRGAFQVTVPPRPMLTGISPNAGGRGQTLAVVLSGTHLTAANSLTFRSGLGIVVNSYTVDSATQITGTVTIAATASTGASDVSVTTPGGTGTLMAGFGVTSVPAPAITVVTPFSRGRGESANATIIGTNLTGATALSFGSGIEVSKFTVDSPTRISAAITIASDAADGVRDVSVTTPGGTYSQFRGFTVAPYSLCKADFSASPRSGKVGTEVQFYCQLTGRVTSGSWDFHGDGIIDSHKCNPTYTYNTVGVFDVILRIYGPDNCESVMIKVGYITIVPKETPEPTPTSWCAPTDTPD